MSQFRSACVLTTVLFAGSLTAQDVTGVIAGVVSDSSGAVIQRAKVSIVNADTGVKAWQGATGDAGAYSAPLLPVGTYNIFFEATGFRRFEVSNLPLAVGDRARVDATLEPGTVQESITVTANTVVHLESDSSSISTEVDPNEVAGLPIANRDVLNLLALTPGVSSGGDATGVNTQQLSFNGSRTLNSEVSVGGVSVVSGAIGNLNHYPSPDAVQQFKVMTSAYSAEYGRTSGASVNMVVANGVNLFHGGAYEYFRNEDLNANNFFNNLRGVHRPPDRRNQFGAKFSGPVRIPHAYNGHDRTFFFFNYDGLRVTSPLTPISTLPDTKFRSGDFSSSPTIIVDPVTRAPFANNQIPVTRLDPAAQRILSLLPQPDSPGTLDAQNNRQVNNYVLSKAQTGSSNDTTSRIDHNFSDKTRIFGFLNESRSRTGNNIQIPGLLDPGTGPSTTVTYLSSLNLTQTFTPSLLAEFRVGFTRADSEVVPPSMGINVQRDLGIQNAEMEYAPTFAMSGWTTFGTNSNTLSSQIDNNYQYAGSITWVKGAHVVKWGAQLRKDQFNVFNPGSDLAGVYNFLGDVTSPTKAQNNPINTLADFLLGAIKTAVSQIPQPETGRRNYNLGVFLQDDWRVSPKLTVNLGMREEYESPTTMANHVFSRVDPYTGQLLVAGVNASQSLNLPTPVKNLAPRAGFALMLDSKTVLRTGLGLFYGQNFSNAGGVVTYPGFAITDSIAAIGNGIAQPFSLSQGIPLIPFTGFNPLQVAAAATEANPLVPAGTETGNLKHLPNSLQWNFGFQRQISAGFVAEANYVASRAIHLPTLMTFNTPYYFALIQKEVATGSGIAIQSTLPFQTVTQFTGVDNVGSSMYNSVQLRAVRQFTHSFSFMAAYTFSKSTDDGSGLWASSQPTSLDRGQYPQLARFLDHSLASFDRTHTLTASMLYTTTGSKWVRGFSVEPLLTVRTGVPMTISQSNLDPGVIQQRPNATAPITGIYTPMTSSGTGIQYLLSPTSPNFPLAPTGPLFATINGKNTEVVPAELGTLGRYDVRAPGDVNLNLALSRRFKLTEKLTFTLRADSYNALNHVNFASPSTSLLVTANSAGQGVFNSPGFGLITTARSARTTQLIARFDF
jgi:hypothetical protein